MHVFVPNYGELPVQQVTATNACSNPTALTFNVQVGTIQVNFKDGSGAVTVPEAGIEAVSNGLPILREPRVQTGRVTMVYMGVSLAVTVAGLLLAAGAGSRYGRPKALVEDWLVRSVAALAAAGRRVSVVTNFSASDEDLARFAALTAPRPGVFSASLHLEYTARGAPPARG